MLRFEDFELDRGAYELRRGGRVVHLERIPLICSSCSPKDAVNWWRATRSWSESGKKGCT
jgi:hypothetical protein